MDFPGGVRGPQSLCGLQEEVIARIEAERRLREAEESLRRLEKAVVSQKAQASEVNKEEQQAVQEEMITDVKTLKRTLPFQCSADSGHGILFAFLCARLL